MPKHQAPVSAAQLHRVLADLGCEIRPPAGGAGQIAVVGDREIRVPQNRPKIDVNDFVLKQVAAALDCTRAELLDALFGRRPVAAAKGQHRPSDGVSKQEALQAVAALARQAEALRDWVGCGTRSPSLYARVHTAAALALKAVDGWPPAAQGVESPDDSGFRPARHDPIKVGAARVAGITAAVAARRATITKFQHDEQSAS